MFALLALLLSFVSCGSGTVDKNNIKSKVIDLSLIKETIEYHNEVFKFAETQFNYDFESDTRPMRSILHSMPLEQSDIYAKLLDRHSRAAWGGGSGRLERLTQSLYATRWYVLNSTTALKAWEDAAKKGEVPYEKMLKVKKNIEKHQTYSNSYYTDTEVKLVLKHLDVLTEQYRKMTMNDGKYKFNSSDDEYRQDLNRMINGLNKSIKYYKDNPDKLSPAVKRDVEPVYIDLALIKETIVYHNEVFKFVETHFNYDFESDTRSMSHIIYNYKMPKHLSIMFRELNDSFPNATSGYTHQELKRLAQSLYQHRWYKINSSKALKEWEAAAKKGQVPYEEMLKVKKRIESSQVFTNVYQFISADKNEKHYTDTEIAIVTKYIDILVPQYRKMSRNNKIKFNQSDDEYRQDLNRMINRLNESIKHHKENPHK